MTIYTIVNLTPTCLIYHFINLGCCIDLDVSFFYIMEANQNLYDKDLHMYTRSEMLSSFLAIQDDITVKTVPI